MRRNKKGLKQFTGNRTPSSTTITTRIGTEDKRRFDAFCKEMGLNISVAINMFIKATLRLGELPFHLGTLNPISNEVTKDSKE